MFLFSFVRFSFGLRVFVVVDVLSAGKKIIIQCVTEKTKQTQTFLLETQKFTHQQFVFKTSNAARSSLQFEAIHFCFFYSTKNIWMCILFDVHNNEKSVHGVFVFSPLLFLLLSRSVCFVFLFLVWLSTLLLFWMLASHTYACNTNAHIPTRVHTAFSFSFSCCSHKGFSEFDISPEIYLYTISKQTIWVRACMQSIHTVKCQTNLLFGCKGMYACRRWNWVCACIGIYG